MRKPVALLGSAIFLVIAPGTVVGYVPWLITHWNMQPPFFGYAWTRPVGMSLVAAGVVPLVESFVRFALKGLGTPAPVTPTRHLVVSGFYRFVRNPMYVGVGAILLGQALLFGSVELLAYAVFVGIVSHLFVRFHEEPTLRRAFGEEYKTYCKNVPRWIPRLSPWSSSI
jgi:protein-S-isoprenylcysteine O-methyltransferase Ste14